MHLLLLYLLLFKVSRAEDLTPVSAYVGKTVTLRSGADPKWELTEITWFIWPNTTWIATYFNNVKNVDRFPKYNGRLQLNTTTGDLTITNLSSADGLEYTVDFSNTEGQNHFNKVKLSIKQQLLEPVIEIIQNPIKDCCVVSLSCTSPDTGVSLSWESNPRLQISGSNGSIFKAIVDTQSTVHITCIATKNSDNKTSTIPVKCSEKNPPTPDTTGTSPAPCNCPERIRDHIPTYLAMTFFFFFCA